MSKLSIFNRFPNELLYEAFEYLTAYDILHAFKGLNQRIDLLLRNYSKYRINLKSCSKSRFDLICQSITCEQIQSLILSNSDDTCRQINRFFRLFYIRKCINIESLELIKITEQDLNKLITKFNILPKLSCLSINLKHGLIPKIVLGSSLKYLSISTCSMSRLYELLLSAPQLVNLNVELIADTNPTDNPLITTNIHRLKLKLIQKSNITFNDIRLLFQWMPKLKQLTFFAAKGMRFIHGYRWELLIRTYLSDLKQFHFAIHPSLDINIQSILSSFQTPFWLEEKKWFIHCNYYHFEDIVTPISYFNTHFYTLPYCDEQFELIFSKEKITKSCKSQYSTVKKLYLSIDCPYDKSIEENYDFPNLDSLTIQNLHKLISINNFINLSQIKHLTIEQANPINPDEFFSYILKRSTNLQSLELSWYTLVEITNNFTDQQVCSLLTKQIKYLNLLGMISNEEKENRRAIELLSKMFSTNLEKLSISVLSIENILFVLDAMFKLYSLKFECNYPSNIDDISLWLMRNIPTLTNFTHELRFLTEKRICLLLWTNH